MKINERASDEHISELTHAATTAVMNFLYEIVKEPRLGNSVVARTSRYAHQASGGFVIYSKQLPGMPPEFHNVLVFLQTSKDFKEPFGAMGNLDRNAYGSEDYNKVIILYCVDPTVFAQNLDASIAETSKTVSGSLRWMNTIEHEFAHVIDENKNNGKGSRVHPVDKETFKGYYNTPSEMNSYFTNLVSGLMSIKRELEKHPDAVDDVVDLYNFKGNMVDDFLTSVGGSDNMTKAWLRALTEENRKRIYKRYATVHSVIMDAVKKAKNAPVKESVIMERASDLENTRIIGEAYSAFLKYFLGKTDNEPWLNHQLDYEGKIIQIISNGNDYGYLISTKRIPGWPKELAHVALSFQAKLNGTTAGAAFRGLGRPLEIKGESYTGLVTIYNFRLESFMEDNRTSLFAECIRQLIHSKEYRSFFAHEVAHAIDHIKTANRGRSVNPTKDRTIYHNSNTEVNSYFTNLVEPLTTVIKTYNPANNEKGFGPYKSYKLTGDPIKDFQICMAVAPVSHVHVWLHDLTKENLRRVFKRFVTVHNEMMDTIKNREAEYGKAHTGIQEAVQLDERETDNFLADKTKRALHAIIRFLMREDSDLYDNDLFLQQVVDGKNSVFGRISDGFLIQTHKIPNYPPVFNNILIVFKESNGETAGSFGPLANPLNIDGNIYTGAVVIHNIKPKLFSSLETMTAALSDCLEDFCYNDDVHGTLIHELSHAYDYRRTKGAYASHKTHQSTERSRYFNRPTEVNAYFTEMVSRLMHAKKIYKSTDTLTDSYFGRFGFNGQPSHDFKIALASAKNSTKEWFKQINDQNRKRVMKRFMTVHAGVMDHLREKNDEGMIANMRDAGV